MNLRHFWGAGSEEKEVKILYKKCEMDLTRFLGGCKLSALAGLACFKVLL